MSRAKRRSGPHGLFTWGRDGTEPGEIRDNPRMRPCPACRAAKGEPCTRPTRGGRRRIQGFHDARRQTEENPR